MDIYIKKDVAEKIGTAKLEPFGYSEDNLRWKNDFSINLANLTRTKAALLRDTLAAHPDLPGVRSRIKDVEAWLEILSGNNRVRCKRIRDFDAMLKQYLKPAPNHWVYETRSGGDVWQPYYVSDITYIPPTKRDGYTSPAYVIVALHYEELGEIRKTRIVFYAEDCEDLTPAQALAEKGFRVEAPDMRASYEELKAKYTQIYDKVGLQFQAVGTATDDVDGNDKKKTGWWNRRTNTIRLETDGVPARVVIDVRKESDEDESSSRDGRPSGTFWAAARCDHEGDPSDDDNDIGPGDEDPPEPEEIVTIPLHPAVVCFDLKRHTRLRVYVEQLTLYRYDTSLTDKLILPDEVRGLVDILVSHRGGFKDIVGGKGNGAVILCAGAPGTGKTLTSEVYSEAMERPLYSVQCSQLGTDPDELESSLLKIFARAARWNVILLLDEADVYVAARGSDLVQNAIVGVFLRTLEYYQGVMFMTTNRADLVDDAVASRCLARIDYTVPTPANQKRIWRTLADGAGITLRDAVIGAVVAKYPTLSGRDVKNLLKLAVMVTAAGAEPITAATIDYVKKFKPTLDPDTR